MICLSETLDEIKILCENSPFGCPIVSAAEAYGLEQPFARFWTDGHAAYSMLDGVMRIAGKILDAQKACVILMNKWDLAQEKGIVEKEATGVIR